MSHLKITFVISSLSAGGAERVLTTLANALVEKFEVSIVTFYHTKSFYPLNDKVSISSCSNKTYDNAGSIGSVINNYRLYKGLVRQLNTQDSDIVISFMTTANVLSILASRAAKIPCIISERNHPDYRKPTRFWDYMRQWQYKKASSLVVQTESIKSYFKALIPDHKIAIIKNPIAPQLENSRNLDVEKDNIILNVGRLEKQKNQSMLIDAFHALNLADWKLIFVGDGSLKAALTKKTHDLQLEDRIAFVKSTQLISNYYNKAKIFVFTSDYEGFPNALTEALYFGIPSISTDCPSGPSELINHGNNGFLIPVRDTNTLIEKLKELTKTKALRDQFSKNAIESTTPYNVKNICKQWMQLINEVTNE